MEAVKNETTKDSQIYVVLFQIYYISLGFLVVLFWSSYLVLIFSFRKEAIDSTPFAKILRVFPGNIRFFSSGYDVNIILVSVGSAYIFFFGVFLNLLYFRYDKGRLWEYNAIAYNVYLPETIRNGLSAIKNADGFVTTFLVTLFLFGEIIYQFTSDVARSITFILPRNLAGLKIRRENGEPLSASLSDKIGKNVD